MTWKSWLPVFKVSSQGALTPEDGNLRKVLYDNTPHVYRDVYRVIYTIDESGPVVRVLHIRCEGECGRILGL
jgi:hypothetical protein